jgi:hypothetical protein
MSSNRDDAKIIEDFKDITIKRLNDVLVALPALVPQSEEDRILFKKGMTAISNLIYDLKHAETPRAVSEFLDVQKILRDFDSESIRTLDTKINTSARASVEQLSKMADFLREDEPTKVG